MTWFRKDKSPLTNRDKRDLPSDVFEQCKGCDNILYSEKLVQTLRVCPNCNHHFRISPKEYIRLLVNEGSFEEINAHLRNQDPLEFTDLKPYPERLKGAQEKLGTNSVVLSGIGSI